MACIHAAFLKRNAQIEGSNCTDGKLRDTKRANKVKNRSGYGKKYNTLKSYSVKTSRVFVLLS